MWRQFSRTRHILVARNVRSFLSDAYNCAEAWQARLNTPVLQQIKADPFYYELDRKFQQHGQVCAVDIDIYANKINDNQQLGDLVDIIHKLRLTSETSNALDSTSHAVIRHHLDFGNDDIVNLIHILDDRLSYGVFLDSYTANLLLDRLIKLKDYRHAAKVATLLMLQENFDNAISRTLSLYACYKYLEDPQPLEEPLKPEADESESSEVNKAEEKTAKPKKKKKAEEIRIRVKFLRNEYFDDHFDLQNSSHLVGKTFLMIGHHLDGSIGNSIKLLGYTLYEKYQEGSKFLESLTNSNDLHVDALELARKQIEKITDRSNDEHFNKYAAQLEELSKKQWSTSACNLEESIKTLAVDAVTKFEQSEIEEQKKIYELWCQIRESKLNEELDRLNRFRRIKEIERLTAELAEKEEKLWFFENEDKYDLIIERNESISKAKEQTQQEIKLTPKQTKRKIDPNYIPPEVGVKRN